MIDKIDQRVLLAMYEAIPAEITVIDHNDEVIGWSQARQLL